MDGAYSFYKSLLVNDTTAFLQSHAKKAKSEELLQKISAHFGLRNQNAEGDAISREDPWNAHMKSLRLLILEECRHTIAEALHRRWNQSKYQYGLQLEVQFEEVREGTPSGVFNADDIKLSRYFTAQDRNDLMRPGAIVELYPVKCGKTSCVGHVFLGTISHQVWTVADKNKRERSVPIPERKAIELYAKGKGLPKDGFYIIYPLISLLSYARQMEASYGLTPDLYPDLMSILPRNGVEIKEDDSLSDGYSDRSANAPPTNAAMPHFIIPQLNVLQEKASTEFLTSSLGSIILVQGCVHIFVHTLIV